MTCRVCQGELETILDMGNQCLSGQFPLIGEPDPPRYPLVLARCLKCSLVQLRDTVDPQAMFTNYWYRSGVTQTMRAHLEGIAREAKGLLGPPRHGKNPIQVLDIGANDGTLLDCLGGAEKWALDPSNQLLCKDATAINGFYPHPYVADLKFDLIFSIACFYDVDTPVAFAKAVRENLAPGGLWCCEVSDVYSVVGKLAWDSVCHEHLCYYSGGTFRNVLARAGLQIVKSSFNKCNGGNLRFYASVDERKHAHAWQDKTMAANLEKFVKGVRNSATCFDAYLQHLFERQKKVHLLGASTKANTVLQYCGVTPTLIQAASDRDPRKIGRCTPGTRIPIISEEESRAQKPDVYVCLIHGFKDEVIAREQAFLEGGGTIVFPLPKFCEVRA
jgi:hypothetical protein